MFGVGAKTGSSRAAGTKTHRQVDESMLTGEPMPIAKMPVEDAPCNHLHVKSNKAYAGTRVIESRGEKENGGLALIYCTEVGARTARGELVRMVLFPSSVKFKYTDQLPLVYAFMCLYAILAVILHLSAVDPGSGVVQYLHILCSLCGALSPMLPVSLVMGQSVSAKRLTGQEYNIKCLQPGRIPIAGKISTMVFDKTGTITKSTMDFAGVHIVHAVRTDVEAQLQSEGARFLQPLRLEALEGCERPGRPETLDSDCECGKAVLESWLLGMPELLHSALAVCHTVTWRTQRRGANTSNTRHMIWGSNHNQGPHKVPRISETPPHIRKLKAKGKSENSDGARQSKALATRVTEQPGSQVAGLHGRSPPCPFILFLAARAIIRSSQFLKESAALSASHILLKLYN